MVWRLQQPRRNVKRPAAPNDRMPRRPDDISWILTVGEEVVPEDLNFLSPHLTSCVKRFGDYTLNTAKPPEPWLNDQPPPRKRPDMVPNQSVLPFVKEA